MKTPLLALVLLTTTSAANAAFVSQNTTCDDSIFAILSGCSQSGPSTPPTIPLFIQPTPTGDTVPEILSGGYDYDDDDDGETFHDIPPSDVAAVPVPAAVWLFLSGFIGLVGIARRKPKEDIS